MIGLDSDAAIAAFQTNPRPNVAVHRDRVRAFLRANGTLRLLFPTVALAEYLFGVDRVELDVEVRRVTADRLFTPSFDAATAEIAAEIGRRFAAGRRLGAVAQELGSSRVALKDDLKIVATAVQHQVQQFLTADDGCYEVARFAGLNAVLVRNLPDLPPDRPRVPPTPPAGSGQPRLFDDLPPNPG